jgi:LPXTG-motif cell wall-anchored protein
MALSKTGRRVVSAAAAALVGMITALVAAAPASASVSISTGNVIECLANGGYAVAFSMTNTSTDYAIKLTGVTSSVPDPYNSETLIGEELLPGSTIGFFRAMPPGTTQATLTVTWQSVVDPSVTGSASATTTQAFPSCQALARAEVDPHCDRTATVDLINEYHEALTFVVGATEVDVAPGDMETLTNVPIPGDTLVILAGNPGLRFPVTEYTWSTPRGCPPPVQPTTPATTTTTTAVTTTTGATTTTTSGAGLPDTGSSVTGVVATGAALVVLGIAVLVIFRVRRQRADAS